MSGQDILLFKRKFDEINPIYTELQFDADIAAQIFSANLRAVFTLYGINLNPITNATNKRLLFSIDPSFISELRENPISDKLKNEFANKKIKLASEAPLRRMPDNTWQINDNQRVFIIKEEENKLNIYIVDDILYIVADGHKFIVKRDGKFLLVYYGKEHIDITELAKKVTDDMIRSSLEKRLGPDLKVFCSDFALICKLDYMLKFMERLVAKWIGQQLINMDFDYTRIRFEALADILIELLARLVNNYRDLTYHRDGSRRRIGLELMGLTRTDEIADRIMHLLLSDRRIEGVNWSADEVNSWYFV